MKELKCGKTEKKGKSRGGQQDDWRDGATLLQGKAEMTWIVQP